MGKAHSDIDPITIPQAYRSLSKQAFAVWIRLLVVPDKQLVNRSKIAKMLGYSAANSDVVLRELKLKGYITWGRYPGRPSRLVIRRRAFLSGPTNFVHLSNICLSTIEQVPDIQAAQLFRPISGDNKKTQFNSYAKLDLLTESDRCNACNRRICEKNQESCNTFEKIQERPDKQVLSDPYLNPQKTPNFLSNFAMATKSLDKTHVSNTTKHTQDFSESTQINEENSAKTSLENNLHPAQSPPKHRIKMKIGPAFEALMEPGLNPSQVEQSIDPAIYNKGLSISKLKKIREENKRKKSEKIKKGIEKKKKRSFAVGQNIDWTKLDQRGDPAISFSPSVKTRKLMIEILDGSNRNQMKRRFIKKMGSEFGRIYSRYRRLLQREAGNQPTYLLPSQEHKYAAAAAEWCVRKEVTPRQVLTYWHMNIANFAERTMKIPPLVFLSSPANIDTVACASLESSEAGWKAGQPKPSTPSSHGFSDLRQLDARLRPALERAGFETQAYNDRHLLTIQKTAIARANGARIFVGADLKAMIDWASRNLYGKESK